MKVTQLETIRIGEFPNILFVQVHTDEGLVGLGETSFGPQAVEAYLHESVAPLLLGADPLQIDRLWNAMTGFVGFQSTGVENRGRSAVDLALWDLFGKATGMPLYQLLGGASRDRIRAYNTCAGYRYVRTAAPGGGLAVDAWGVGGEPEGPFEDLDAFLHRPAELARSLLGMGITAMKIWPFDPFAEKTGGHGISNADLAAGLRPLEEIRDGAGDAMEIMLEMHSLWDVPTAIRIARAAESLGLTWIEDPIRMDSIDMLARVAAATPIPVTASETLGTRWAFRDLIERGGVSIVMFDPVWVGGISESRRIVGMAEAAHLPVAVHDCLGPVEYVTAIHLSINAPNALIQESVRAFWTGWYRDLVTVVPQVTDGHLNAPDGPGLGTELLPGMHRRTDVMRRISQR